MLVGGKIKKVKCSARLSLHITTLDAMMINQTAITQSKKSGRQAKKWQCRLQDTHALIYTKI